MAERHEFASVVARVCASEEAVWGRHLFMGPWLFGATYCFGNPFALLDETNRTVLMQANELRT